MSSTSLLDLEPISKIKVLFQVVEEVVVRQILVI